MGEVTEDRASEALADLLKVFVTHKLNTREIVLVLSNLLYSLGASIEGYDGEGPSVEEVMKMYNESPSVGVNLMAQGMHMNATWLAAIDKLLEGEE